MLKGRANYVCATTTSRARGRRPPADARRMRRICRRSSRFAQIDRAPATRPSSPTCRKSADLAAASRRPATTASAPNARTTRECFVMKARREAQEADVVVVNHHLFFADIMLRDEGIAELLPTANTIIFDEAHQLPETATLFFGDDVSTAQILELARDALAEGFTHARDALDWAEARRGAGEAARDLRLALGTDRAELSRRAARRRSAPFHGALDDAARKLDCAGRDAGEAGGARRSRSSSAARATRRRAGANGSRAGGGRAPHADGRRRTRCAGSKCSRTRCSCNATPLSVAADLRRAARRRAARMDLHVGDAGRCAATSPLRGADGPDATPTR